MKKLVPSIVIFILLLIPVTVLGDSYLLCSYKDKLLNSISFHLNNPPENVSIDGPIRGKAGTSYEYTFNCDDPEGDDVNYYIKWGTPSCPVIYGPYPSSSPAIIGFVWGNLGRYNITVKAVDIHGAESDIISLTVTMPIYHFFHRINLQFFAKK